MAKTKLEKDLFYYGDYLELIGNFDLSKQITLKDLGDTDEDKAVIQKCYRDIKNEKFDGTVIDYLCWISTQYVRSIWIKEFEKGKTGLYITAEKYVKDCATRLPKKYIKITPSLILGIMSFIILKDNKHHSRNMLRLFNKRPDIIIKGRVHKHIINILFEYFTTMMLHNFYEYLKKNLLDKVNDDELWGYIFPMAVDTLVIWHGIWLKTELIVESDFNKLFID